MKVQLNANLIFELSVDCSPPYELGKTNIGAMYVIPIMGGSFQGDGMGESIKGEILPLGADWNSRYGIDPINATEFSHVRAEYLLKTDDGIIIRVFNEGYKSWQPNTATEIVTVPRFQVGKGKYDWLNYGVYVGSLKARPNKSGVEIKIYRLD